MRVARANAESRRTMAVAEEQEMIAQIEDSRSQVVEAGGPSAQGHRAGVPRRHARNPRLLQAEECPGRHGHARGAIAKIAVPPAAIKKGNT